MTVPVPVPRTGPGTRSYDFLAGIPFTTAPGPIPFSANQPLRISSA